MNTKFCPNCGKKVNADAQSCPNCGFSFNEHQAQAPQRSITQDHHSKDLLYILLSLIIIILILSGLFIYNNNRSSSNHSNVPNTSGSNQTQNSQSTTTSNSSSNYSDNIVWNSAKASSFDDQFDSWASKMHQSYVSGFTSFDGIDYPDDFSSKKFIINGSNSTISMAGSNKNTDYKVVEIRYDNDDGYLYLFAFHDGSPIVLFTQSGDSNGDTVSFKTTANGELRNIFSNFSAN